MQLQIAPVVFIDSGNPAVRKSFGFHGLFGDKVAMLRATVIQILCLTFQDGTSNFRSMIFDCERHLWFQTLRNEVGTQTMVVIIRCESDNSDPKQRYLHHVSLLYAMEILWTSTHSCTPVSRSHDNAGGHTAQG